MVIFSKQLVLLTLFSKLREGRDGKWESGKGKRRGEMGKGEGIFGRGGRGREEIGKEWREGVSLRLILKIKDMRENN